MTCMLSTCTFPCCALLCYIFILFILSGSFNLWEQKPLKKNPCFSLFASGCRASTTPVSSNICFTTEALLATLLCWPEVNYPMGGEESNTGACNFFMQPAPPHQFKFISMHIYIFTNSLGSKTTTYHTPIMGTPFKADNTVSTC